MRSHQENCNCALWPVSDSHDRNVQANIIQGGPHREGVSDSHERNVQVNIIQGGPHREGISKPTLYREVHIGRECLIVMREMFKSTIGRECSSQHYTGRSTSGGSV